jgi:DNA topoisomerase-3
MEDQVAKLRQLGVRAGRIHSGIPRPQARETCREYLDGQLDFLFIAPERLGVAGFPELLAKRVPSLVAVDEAHCISHWGHDFRPDYRLLSERLPALRPAPVLALTATATPRVQEDIVAQLNLQGARRYIHGFRRDNLAIEVVEMIPSQRHAAATQILGDPSALPAIVYAPTRRATEELAEILGHQRRAAAYHAGMSTVRRDASQRRFQAGELDVMVATIAFGMGIDKADIRTVVHTGLPSSLEGYYQEIGRAGRDGLPARAVLLFSWADRRTHEYFLDRDYPDPELLEAVFRKLSDEPQEQDGLRARLRLDEDSFPVVIDKLWSFGGARVLADQRLVVGSRDWRRDYLEQRRHRQQQLDEILRFASGIECRMQRIVRHFGDASDTAGGCGICDRCAPGAAQFRNERTPTDDERAAMQTVLEILAEQRSGLGTGTLFKRAAEVHGALQRDELEVLLVALQQVGLVTIEPESFFKDGEEIHYQRARLSGSAKRGRYDLDGVTLSGVALPPGAGRARSPGRRAGGGRARRGTAAGKAKAGTAPKAAAATKRESGKREFGKRVGSSEPARQPPAGDLVQALRALRLEEARRLGVPAFRIFSDRVMLGIAEQLPGDEEALLAVPGVGPAFVRRYGARVLELCRAGDD